MGVLLGAVEDDQVGTVRTLTEFGVLGAWQVSQVPYLGNLWGVLGHAHQAGVDGQVRAFPQVRCEVTHYLAGIHHHHTLRGANLGGGDSGQGERLGYLVPQVVSALVLIGALYAPLGITLAGSLPLGSQGAGYGSYRTLALLALGGGHVSCPFVLGGGVSPT